MLDDCGVLSRIAYFYLLYETASVSVHMLSSLAPLGSAAMEDKAATPMRVRNDHEKRAKAKRDKKQREHMGRNMRRELD